MTGTDFGQAFRLGLAAWTAFAAATALGIEHAFWAAMPVWVVAQPWRGVIFERALWRLLGTVIGGAAGLALLAVSPAPWATALGMALLLAAGAALMHLRQGVSSYLPLMSAITVAVVVLPAMLDPAGGLHLALDRLACTLIGGIAVAVIVGLFTPRADTPGFRSEGAALVRRFEAAADLLLGSAATPEARDAAVAEAVHAGAALEARARLVAAGSRDGYRRMAALDAGLAAGLALLEAAGALEADPGARADAQRLMAGAPVPLPASGPLARLAAARAALARADAELQSLAPSGRALPRIAPPGNPAMALRAALLAGLASLAGSAMLILTGSFAAELTAFSMAIFALVLGSVPLPHVLAPKLAAGVLLGAAAGTAYRLGIQPHADGWAALVLTILPFIAFGALARATPRSAPYALDANMCFMLASQAGAAAAPAADVLVAGLSMAAGTLALAACYMAVPRPGRHLIARTRGTLARDIRRLSRSPAPAARRPWPAIWGRRLVTLAVELDKAGETLPRDLLRLATAGHDALDPAPGGQNRSGL
ncbi:FUSC family protein [Poseidonocella sp. HB161398]|uniref:FUSC family protein n=1 Tax=Poseidonocella sp. HB161398 TaxID=2320855 RepID=UPI001108E79A|nr:FUSC family protein [Poseidonocella sp. HB161398]